MGGFDVLLYNNDRFESSQFLLLGVTMLFVVVCAPVSWGEMDIMGITTDVAIGIPQVYAQQQGAANLVVSAAANQDTVSSNRFAGSMVVEVVVSDPDIGDTGEPRGEPDVTLNGNTLRMVQASDGNWYAYFANVDKAQAADQAALDGAVLGVGLDFGVFCSRDTDKSVFGIDFSETDGFAVAHRGGLVDFTDGITSFVGCSRDGNSNDDDDDDDASTSLLNLNNVVRGSKSVNTNTGVPVGQIGLADPAIWPVIQLFSFNDDVVIRYRAAGNTQTINLEYDDGGGSLDTSIKNDREYYPSNSEVFLTITDVQLNQDPTDRDSWTFGVGPVQSVFYQAFDSRGSDSANGGRGLINLIDRLGGLGFGDNGLFTMTMDSIVYLKTNKNQPKLQVTDGSVVYSDIVTFVETEPNSAVFVTHDYNDDSVIGIVDNVRRGLADNVWYNGDSISLLSSSSTGSISTSPGSSETLMITVGSDNNKKWRPGTQIPISVFDADQNINSAEQDHLDVFRSTAIIPTLVIGDPITLSAASRVKIYESSTDPLTGGAAVPSTVSDHLSSRLFITFDHSTTGLDSFFEKISINLGVSSSEIANTLINSRDAVGTNWFQYDLRALHHLLGLTDLSDTSIKLYPQGFSSTPVVLADSGDLGSSSSSSFQDLIRIDDSTTADIISSSSVSGTAYLVFDFDASDDDSASLFTGPNTVYTPNGRENLDGVILPIVFDVLSFGLENNNKNRDVNNAIYRFELEESGDNTGVFEGTLEYTVTNQLNVISPQLIESLTMIDDDIKFLVPNVLLDKEQGITISYSDLASTGVNIVSSIKSGITTHSGVVSTDADSYRFGRSVTVTLNDPDLNLQHDRIDIYRVINDPSSPHVDTVGSLNGDTVLLDIIIKGVRYKRCTVAGVEHGGLASTGFTLQETGHATGIFQGSFKMPSKICNDDGTRLISPAGGNIDVKYFDFLDSSGRANIATLSRAKSSSSDLNANDLQPMLNLYSFEVPTHPNSVDVVLTGTVAGHKRGIPATIILVSPDDTKQTFGAYPTSSGKYRTIFSLNSQALVGVYVIDILYNDKKVGSTSFEVLGGSKSSSSAISPRLGLSDLKSDIKAQIGSDVYRSGTYTTSSSAISDASFYEHIVHLLQNNLLIPDNPTVFPQKLRISEAIVPNWIKNNVGLWANGIISDNDYLNSIKYLINEGIIRI